MERQILKEELDAMKYLLSYERGVVISEQKNIVSEETGMGSMMKEKIQSMFDKEVANDPSLGEVANNAPSVDDIVSNDEVCDIVTGNEEHDNIISKVKSELLRMKNEKGANSLWEVLKNVKKGIKMAIVKNKTGDTSEPEEVNEQIVAGGIMIGTAMVGWSALIAIGAIILIIIIAIIVMKNDKQSPGCRKNLKWGEV
jgi:bacterioferritin (cytochrome b1)